MVTRTLPHILDVPAELVTAIAEDADRDADRVGLFLRRLGLEGSAHGPLLLPASFLLNLGAALRLLDWELRGLRVHIEEGLPSAQEAVRAAFLAVSAQSNAPISTTGMLAYRVMTLFIERFAWNARKELDAQVTLEEADEDRILEELADYLWEHCPR